MVAKLRIEAGVGYDVDVSICDVKTEEEIQRIRVPRSTVGTVDLHVAVIVQAWEVTAEDLVKEMKAKAKADAKSA